MEYLVIVIITFISGVVGTGLGGVLGAVLKRDSNKIISLLLSFAAGIMLAVVCFDLMSEAVEMMNNNVTSAKLAPLIVAAAVIVGYGIVHLLNFLLDKKTDHEVEQNHPRADDLNEHIHSTHYATHKNSKSNLFMAGLIMMSAIAIHNLPEGMVIGVSYASEDAAKALFSSSGFILAIVIGLHNVPAGMAISVPLISGGMSKPKAVLLTALSGLPTVFGALIGFALGGVNDITLVLSLGFAGGAMLYVVFGELLPKSILMWRSKLQALAIFVGMMIGFILVLC